MWSDVYSSDCLVMTFQFIFEHEFGPGSAVELDVVVSSDCECLTVCREGVVGDGVVEEMVDFGARHVEICNRSSSLLLREWN